MNVRVLYNQHGAAVQRGYRPDDPLRRVYAGELDLPVDEQQALAVIWALFSADADGTGERWERHRVAQLGTLPPRDIATGDVVVLDGQRAYGATPLRWQPAPLPGQAP